MSKRKRGGTNKPAGSTPEKPASAEGDATERRASSASASKPPSPFPSVPPPTAQGKPIKISDLRVPPLPQLDTNAPAARPAKKSPTPAASTRGKRTSEPPKSPVPQAKAVVPQAEAGQPQADQSSFAASAGSPRIVEVASTAQGQESAPAPGQGSARTPARPSIANTIAPPHKRARAAEQRAKAEEERDRASGEERPSEVTPVPRDAAQPAEASAAATPATAAPVATVNGAAKTSSLVEPAAPALYAVDAAPALASSAVSPDTSRSNTRINGTVFPALASEATARFDESNEDEIWIEGIEHTATAAGGLPSGKSSRESGDDSESHEPASRLARGSTSDRAREAAAFGSAESLLSTDYYFRQYGAHGLRSLAAEVDDFGFDPHVDAKVRPALEVLCRRYFRVELEGAEQVPEHGRALLVANRSGALPWDGLVLRTALRSARPGLSPLRWLAEDSVIHYPFMGVFMNRLGAVRACPENAERLLTQDRLVAVFPEGAQGSRKLFRDRYRLQRFGRGGYVKLALKLGVPILPTAIIGAEETNPVLGRSRFLGRFIGSDAVPITPTFPWFGLAGLLPAPVRWRIVVGAPIDLSGYGPESAEDALVVHRLNEQIRSSLQTLVDQGKQQRGSALFG